MCIKFRIRTSLLCPAEPNSRGWVHWRTFIVRSRYWNKISNLCQIMNPIVPCTSKSGVAVYSRFERTDRPLTSTKQSIETSKHYHQPPSIILIIQCSLTIWGVQYIVKEWVWIDGKEGQWWSWLDYVKNFVPGQNSISNEMQELYIYSKETF